MNLKESDCEEKSPRRGQALVETAIIAPIVIFMLIGVFEVGWALRGYLVLANANREAARFAVRPGYLDFTIPQPQYDRAISHSFTAMSGQIDFSGTIIISHFYVDVGYICDPGELCDCPNDVNNPISPTIVMSPLNVPTYSYTYPATSTDVTRLDYAEYEADLVRQNRMFQCEFQNRERGRILRPESQVVVEFIYYQNQLFGFPLISNPLTDPVRMYAHSTFRQIVDRN